MNQQFAQFLSSVVWRSRKSHGAGTVITNVERLDDTIVRHCLDRNIHYTVIATSFKTLAMVLRLKDTAEHSRSAVIAGVGLIPGLSAVLAAHMARSMNSVEQVNTHIMLGAGDVHGVDAVRWMQEYMNRLFTVKTRQGIQTVRSLKVLKELYVMYMIWTFWALAVLVTGFLISLPFFEFTRTMDQSTLTAITNPAQVFLFIVGLITGVYIIQYYIRQGVTRRRFFIGTVAAALATTVSILLIGVGLHIPALLLEVIAPFQAGRLLTEYLGQVHSYPVTMGISTLMLSLHFLLGWTIGFVFCRFGTITHPGNSCPAGICSLHDDPQYSGEGAVAPSPLATHNGIMPPSQPAAKMMSKFSRVI